MATSAYNLIRIDGTDEYDLYIEGRLVLKGVPFQDAIDCINRYEERDEKT